MKEIIYLDPGHSATDPGAMRGSEQESFHVREVCKILAPMLRADGFSVVMVPDNLNLTETVKFINSNVSGLEDGYAFAVHINANADDSKPGRGAEGWHCAGTPGTKEYETGKALIKTIVDKYCEVVGFPNRGIKSDDKAPDGSLLFTRKTKCYAGLLELCFINNPGEMTRLKNNYQLIAEGLRQGFDAAFGIKEENMQIENIGQLNVVYRELLMRDADDGAKGYLDQSESFVREQVMASAERKGIEELVTIAREL